MKSISCAAVILAFIIQLCLCQVPRLAILIADDGTYSGTSEAFYIQQKLTNPMNESVEFCESAVTGYLPGLRGMQLPALILTTGIGEVNSALCTISAMKKYTLTKIISVGTSGMSPVLGGLNPKKSSGCSEDALSKTPISIGSVCISSVAYNMACGLCTYNDSTALPNECSWPDCKFHDDPSLFGPCMFAAVDSSLEDALTATALKMHLPMIPSALAKGLGKYWAAFGHSPPTAASIVSSCAEADLQQIYASGPMEFMCRQRAANYLAFLKRNDSITPDNTPCVAAMEGIGFMHAAVPHSASTKLAILRGASNYAVYPLKQDQHTGKWIQQVDYIPAKEHEDFIKAGYMFSILTTNSIVLEYLSTQDRP